MLQDTTTALATTIKSNGWPILGIIITMLSPIKWLMVLVGFMIVLGTMNNLIKMISCYLTNQPLF